MSLRLILLIVLGLCSLIAIGVLGYQYWDVLVAGLFAVVVWAKKLMTLGGALGLLKKLPFLFMAGLKKLFFKILGGLMLLSVQTRFRPVRRVLLVLKFMNRRLLRRLRFHWQDLGPLERTLTLAMVLPVGTVIVLAFALFLTPRPLRTFAAKKLQAASGETVLRRMVPGFLRRSMEAIHRGARRLVRGRVRKKDCGEP